MAGCLYAVTGPFFWIHGSIMGKRKRLLAERAVTPND
jgi:hypothetical protein